VSLIFPALIIRDGEMAAVTIGESMAFVYRHEALYPLTGSLKDLEPTDLYGDHVEGFNDFIAGEAGTIRYSNIAQIGAGRSTCPLQQRGVRHRRAKVR